ncbi:DUF3558 domain-containing protein [Streptomyces sp. NPDC050400]|uniref:DUF3558 domain-containing protein n=1 Tax=Streptomyces sp. NPDC050400 TaxID=3365610 RepID=UPI0037B40105
MQRKSYAYVPGVAVLLTALLAGCTGSSDSGGGTDDSKPGEVSASATSAKPGRYRSLPEACAQVDKATLDEMLPGIEGLPDEEQREKAYEGAATETYDTDRRVGCGWKDSSADAGAHRLTLDFERVVSYDAAVSDDSSAEDVFGAKQVAADLPVPSVSSADDEPTAEGSAGASDDGSGAPSGDASDGASATATSSVPPADLQPRVLDDLGDEAFVDDVLAGPTAARHRTVTVVFRTSNVVVTVEYEAQSAAPGEVPDSKEMQDTVQELAGKLVGRFGE